MKSKSLDALKNTGSFNVAFSIKHIALKDIIIGDRPRISELQAELAM
jgi:hypothetical protein